MLLLQELIHQIGDLDVVEVREQEVAVATDSHVRQMDQGHVPTLPIDRVAPGAGQTQPAIQILGIGGEPLRADVLLSIRGVVETVSVPEDEAEAEAEAEAEVMARRIPTSPRIQPNGQV